MFVVFYGFCRCPCIMIVLYLNVPAALLTSFNNETIFLAAADTGTGPGADWTHRQYNPQRAAPHGRSYLLRLVEGQCEERPQSWRSRDGPSGGTS